MKSIVALAARYFAGAIAVLVLGTSFAFAVVREPLQSFVLHDAPKSIANIEFRDGSGMNRFLADFRGKVVILNIWATWCTPCRREMPTLDRLQAELGGEDFEVVALSIDRAGIRVIDKFYNDIGITRLERYVDVSGKAARDIGAPGLPTTLLIDREGREVGRLIGPAEWDAPEMMTFIRSRIGKETNT